MRQEIFAIAVGDLIASAILYFMAERWPMAVAATAFLLGIIAGVLWYYERLARKKCVPFSNQIGQSPYEFTILANQARKSIFAIGPNLNYLAKDRTLKDFLFGKLADGCRVKMLISDPTSSAICDVMQRVSFTDTFKVELQQAVQEFTAWSKDASGRPRPLDLRIKKTDAVTLSLLFIDAEEADGRVLVIPVPWRVPGRSRPCLLISKQQHPVAFGTYFNNYSVLFDTVAGEI